MSIHPLWIDGVAQAGDASDPVIDPATEAVVGYAARASDAQVDSAVDAARRAFPAWAADPAARRDALRTAAAALREHADEVATLITREQGRPLRFAHAEVAGAIAVLEHHAAFDAPPPQSLRDDDTRFARVERRPLGVVAAIAPWNVPVVLLLLKVAPALHAGNTVVAKPSEHTPLSTLRVASILGPAFPPGVLNVIAGPGSTGARLAAHPQVRLVTFTGSVATGKRLYASGADDVKRLTLELGGNDAAIVLDDADPQAIAEPLFWGAFWNSGQVCFAIKRLYVHERVFEPLLAALVARAQRTVVGPGLEPASELGPLTTREQFDRVQALVDHARARGARIHAGGVPLERAGFFYPPTLVTHVGIGDALVDEEQFGPVLPLIPFHDPEDAIAAANASRYGLGASVWSRSVDRALAVARRLEAGLVWVNQHGEILPGAPKGGHKWSGLGYEGGARGYDQFSELQVVNVARG
ncbi:betaine-aldehyde dehydrogenase [Burkholderia aenigmatica]|uniref:Betaine-aldehyde dehydrogenase n=2 Tax=Burkholderia TaxID=32008 RepID=A0A6J5IS26_9BURK|nr:aldehyde dehydrogenase family protein [Burkholderia aenigmatica]CAB3961499.1 betaine-aldehyde dehydrogenase [Burkholderia aenigmatica]